MAVELLNATFFVFSTRAPIKSASIICEFDDGVAGSPPLVGLEYTQMTNTQPNQAELRTLCCDYMPTRCHAFVIDTRDLQTC
jgi:hypothetical protein